MNEMQKKAAERLRKALIEAGKAGLQGGVFDSSFYVWPSNTHIEPGYGFFDRIEKCGGVELYTPGIALDGGAGT